MATGALEQFLSGCSLDEIKEIIFSLVEQYFPVMDGVERQDFILKLLGKSGDDKLSSMVHRWIAECMDEGVDPKNLCRQIITAIDEYAELESLANPEIRTLFIDWMEELQEEVHVFYNKTQDIVLEDLAERFKISRQGAEFLIEKMKKEGKLK